MALCPVQQPWATPGALSLVPGSGERTWKCVVWKCVVMVMKTEEDRLRALIHRMEWIWGGSCPWCGAHNSTGHHQLPDKPCPAFSGMHEVRVGPPPAWEPGPYQGGGGLKLKVKL
jgi:hypothetical protein